MPLFDDRPGLLDQGGLMAALAGAARQGPDIRSRMSLASPSASPYAYPGQGVADWWQRGGIAGSLGMTPVDQQIANFDRLVQEKGPAGITAADLESNPILAAFVSGIKAVGKTPKTLPMDEASRMARAREMGFDVDTQLYHGTPQNEIAAFDLGRAGTGAGAPKEAAVFVTPKPHAASEFAEILGTEYGLPGSNAPSQGAVYPLVVRRGKVYQSPLEHYHSKDMAAEIKKARDAGYDSIEFPKMSQNWDREAGQIAVFDPRNIRSRFAAFDPAQRRSANILATMGGLGLLGAMGAGLEDPYY